jgi:flagellar protein FliS
MFSHKNPASTYAKVGLESKVASANPHQLITLLYEGAIEALHQASMHMQAKHFEQKGHMINKAMAIINEGLLASLNKDVGGELAHNLAALYDYMGYCLLAANRTNNAKAVQDVIKLLMDLKEAWLAIDPDKTSGASATSDPKPASFVYA